MMLISHCTHKGMVSTCTSQTYEMFNDFYRLSIHVAFEQLNIGRCLALHDHVTDCPLSSDLLSFNSHVSTYDDFSCSLIINLHIYLRIPHVQSVVAKKRLSPTVDNRRMYCFIGLIGET